MLRSDNLHQLTAEGQQALLDYGLRSILDLRKSAEMQKTRNVFFGSDRVAYYHQNMVGDVLIRERERIPFAMKITGIDLTPGFLVT